MLVPYHSTYPLTGSISQIVLLDEIISTTKDKLDDATVIPNTTPDMEENADTEVDVEGRYIIVVNDDTTDNNEVHDEGIIKVASKDSNTV